MKRIYEYACENGHRKDALTDYETVSVPCECGREPQNPKTPNKYN